MIDQGTQEAFDQSAADASAVLDQQMSRKANLDELLVWANDFIKKSAAWRLKSFEPAWHNYQRDADGIYDPVVKASKASWQSTAFIPLIPSHRETIQAALYKTQMGARPQLEMKTRGEVPEELDQSSNIRDLILRELEKCRFDVGYHSVLDDKTTYGSGFARIRFETRTEDRKVRKPVHAELDPMYVAVMAQNGQLPTPEVIGYEDVIEQVITYRGIRFDWVSIWDVFPDPRALTIKGNAVGLRYPITYGEVVKGVEQGYFFPEAKDALKGISDEQERDPGKREVETDRQISQEPMSRTLHAKNLKCIELFARIPKKWAYLNGEQIDDPEKLVPARIIFHENAVLAVELNDQYDGEAPVYKDDYLPVNGQFYGRGIPEMLGGLQDVINEGVNGRIDALGLANTQTKAVIAQFLVDPKADLDGAPGRTIRFDWNKMTGAGITDLRAALMQLDFANIDRAAFLDPQEMERYAQERTGANRQTLSTAGQVNDQNKTLGGMQLLLGQAQERFAYIGMLSEFAFMYEVFRAIWKNIYSNIEQADVIAAIGEERAARFILLSPEEIEQDYKYEPQGIFTQDNKGQVQARLGAVFQQFAAFPWVKPEAFFDKEIQSIGEDPQNYRLSEQELYDKLMAQGMVQGPLPAPGPQKESGGTASGA